MVHPCHELVHSNKKRINHQYNSRVPSVRKPNFKNRRCCKTKERSRQIQDCRVHNLLGNVQTGAWSWAAARPVVPTTYSNTEGIYILAETKVVLCQSKWTFYHQGTQKASNIFQMSNTPAHTMLHRLSQ